MHVPLYSADVVEFRNSQGAVATPGEDAAYLSRQLVTCLGNKRALLGAIGGAVADVKHRLGKDRLRVFDAFSGSGVVSRFFKAHASFVASNDLEAYAAAVGRCYLRNRTGIDHVALDALVAGLNAAADTAAAVGGFIEELYAPRDERRITRDDRVFYTIDNARRLDTYRQALDAVPPDLRDLVLGPLLSAASIHANTAGVFKGFYKDRATRVGRFGGTGADALGRIRGQIRLEAPVLSAFECDYEVRQGDAQAAAGALRGLDLAYLDPPYNEHPYGSNYFMLNLLVSYERPRHISRVSGIPDDWRRSGYNVRARALPLLLDLFDTIDAPFVLVSFNDEGFVPPADLRAALDARGRVSEIAIPYPAFRGSRSFAKRAVHVTEHLFLVERA